VKPSKPGVKLREGIVKRVKSRGFLNKGYVVALVLSAVIVCVVAVGGFGGPIMLLNTPIAVESPLKADNQQVLDESETKPVDGDSEKDGEWQTVRMRVTAYCACPKCCGKNAKGITACNYKIKDGDSIVAADRKYPFGSEMIVPGYNGGKPVEVLDRGGLIKGNRLDVFFPSHEEALKWGVKYLDVKIRCR
jgi:3D (Asp-Asp-Asp) domain-containing protein